jgi:hypothetical protein
MAGLEIPGLVLAAVVIVLALTQRLLDALEKELRDKETQRRAAAAEARRESEQRREAEAEVRRKEVKVRRKEADVVRLRAALRSVADATAATAYYGTA